MSDDPISECPKCGKQPRRIFYPAGIVFKGSGFYKNDSRGTPSSSDTPTAPESKPDAASTSSDAKPAAGETPKETPKPAPDQSTKKTKED
jgi:hypothetical protein